MGHSIQRTNESFAGDDVHLKALGAPFVALLKGCVRRKDLHEGTKIHADILLQRGLLQKNPYVASSLISMYARCDAIANAQQVLDELPVRNVVSWNALIAGYVQLGQIKEALNCYEWLQCEASPNVVTFICVLRAYGSIGAADKGMHLHDEIVRLGLLDNDIMLGNALVDMYAKCERFWQAQQVLDDLPVRDAVTWNALITGYVNQRQGEEALICFERMQQEALLPNTVTFICVLKACGSIRATDKGKLIHDEIINQGLLREVNVGNALLDMYIKFNLLAKAQQILNELPTRNVVSWSTLITGYAEWDQGEEALDCFHRMQYEGLNPNEVTLISILKACGSLRDAKKGRKFHEEIINQGLVGKNTVVCTTLIDMYAKCGELIRAQQVLDQLHIWDTVAWNALIAGYKLHGLSEEALVCFDKMHGEGVMPNLSTFICALKACGNIGAIDKGEQIHDKIAAQGLLQKDTVLLSALVDMYVKCGRLGKAQQVLDEVPIRDVVSWNALITGFVQHGKAQDALSCLKEMQCEGFYPDTITFASILKACGSIGAVEKGKCIHDEVSSWGLFPHDVVLGSALVDMYAKCGVLLNAQQVLCNLPVRDVVAWSALIAGYAQQEQGEEALNCFKQMQNEGFSPNAVTFICILKACGTIAAIDKGKQIHSEGLSPDDVTFACVLNTCSRAGLVDEGQLYLASMSNEYGVFPDLEHHTTVIDLFGRAAHIDEAMTFFKKISFSNDPPAWSAILGACLKWGNLGLATWAFECLLQVKDAVKALDSF